MSLLPRICAVRCAVRSVCAQQPAAALQPLRFWMMISILARWGGGCRAFSETSCMQELRRSPRVLLPWVLGQTGTAWSGPSASVAQSLDSAPPPMQVRERPAFDFLMAAPRVLKSATKANGPGSLCPVPCCLSIVPAVCVGVDTGRLGISAQPGISSTRRECLPNYCVRLSKHVGPRELCTIEHRLDIFV